MQSIFCRFAMRLLAMQGMAAFMILSHEG
jgi:hypothetical protein